MPEILLTQSPEFEEERFKTFRLFSIRLGFMLASMPFIGLIPQWFLNPEAAIREAPACLAGSLAWAIYPTALILRFPRRLIPYFVYGPALAITASILSLLSNSESTWAEYGTLLSMFYIVPLLGMPLNRKENIVGIIILTLLPSSMAFILHPIGPIVIQLNTMVIPTALIAIFLQGLFNKQLSEKFNYIRKIEELAQRDPLTNAYNRGFFMETGERMLKQSYRSKKPLSLIMLDIDHFKSVNDRFGHAAGDLVIRHTVQLLTQSLRETDLIARLGGEEFVALLPETALDAGLLTGERVRAAIEEATVDFENLSVPIRFTASLGVAELNGPGESLASLLARADQALYEAKRGGRNRVVSAPSDPLAL